MTLNLCLDDYRFKTISPINLKTKPIPPIAPIANNTNLRWVK